MFDDHDNQEQVDESEGHNGAGDGFESIAPIAFEPTGGGIGQSGFDRHRWLLIGSFVLLGLIGLSAWYVFSGSSVLIRFEPEADLVELDGVLLDLELDGRRLLHTGVYTLRAEREGYRGFEQQITIEDRKDQEFLFQLIKLPGLLTLTASQTAEARVFIDGEPIGPVPLESYQIEAGIYDLAVRAPRYQPWDLNYEIEGGKLEQTIEVELLPAWAEVFISSTPAGATLYIDGDPMGETPLTAQALEGARSLELRLEGFKNWSKDLRVVALQAVDLPPVALEKADNIVRVDSTPGGASVTVDGEYAGQTPMDLSLQPGPRYRIGFSKAGYVSNQRELAVVQGDDSRLQVRLQPILGEVLVAGSPGDAEVIIDGVRRGTLNDPLRLPAHPHRIEVRKEGYEPYSITLTPNPDLQQKVDVSLLSLDEIKASRTPDIWTASNGYQLKLIRPSGIFRLGSGRREQGRRSNEFMRQVQLQRPYYIGRKEITNREYWAFNGKHDSGVVERQTLSLKEQPVVRLSWDHAARYCNWMSEQEGLPPAYTEFQARMVPVSPMTTGYRLPTEAEWAYAARYEGQSEGRAARKYPWGTQMPPASGSGNYAGIESRLLVQRALGNYQDQYAATAQVAQSTANSLGLFDIGGNVREWIHDYYVIHTGGLGAIPVDPMGPSDGGNHVIRGASWRSASITELRLAFRDEGLDGADDLGLRVVRYAE